MCLVNITWREDGGEREGGREGERHPAELEAKKKKKSYKGDPPG